MNREKLRESLESPGNMETVWLHNEKAENLRRYAKRLEDKVILQADWIKKLEKEIDNIHRHYL